MANTIEGKYLKTLLRINKGRNIIVMLLRIGVIGLKDLLYRIKVLVDNPRYKYS